MRKYFFILILLLISLRISADGKIQKFFNLTAEEVKIDSLLPYFSYSIPLGEDYIDSIYSVKLEYPEFIEMRQGDIERYLKITDDTLSQMPEITSNVVVERKHGHLEVSFVPLVMREGKYMKLVSFMLEVNSSAKKKKSRKLNQIKKASSLERYAQHSVLQEGSWVKIRVSSSGIYQITDAIIRSAGFTDLSKVKVYGYGGALQNETLESDDLFALDDLMQVPTCTKDGRKLFYAQGPVSWSSNTATKRTRNPYSDYGYYFLTQNDDEALSLDENEFLNTIYPNANDYHTIHEVDNYAWYEGGRNLFESTEITSSKPKEYTLENVSSNQPKGTLSIGVTAGQATSVQIEVNDSLVGTLRMSLSSYEYGAEAEATYNLTSLKDVNTIKITTTSGGPARLDYISICQEEPAAKPDLESSSFNTPDIVGRITNQDLHQDEKIDMVIIVPTSGKLTEQALRIKQMHEEKDSMRVKIVSSEELFNEFSSGTPDANAYRRYLKMLYDRAEEEEDMPKYLLLFGDCVWDNRMNSSECSSLNPNDLLLCYESENSFSSTNSYVDDGFFTYLDDGEGGSPTTDKGDIAVGRFPVRDATDAKTMVDKTINYRENENAGSWQNIIMFMGDDGNENQHMKHADEMASLVEEILPSIYVKRVMWDSYNRVSSTTGNSYPDVEKIIKQQQSDGALIMNYSGHGRADQLSHESVLRLSDFEEFTNTNLPLWITASCDVMPYDGQVSNIGESSVLNSKGGAVAFFGAARTVFVDRNLYINREFLRAMLTPQNGKYISLGEAERVAKNTLVTSGNDRTVNKLQYALLGDPALVLNIPQHKVIVDSINGISLNENNEPPSLNAGSIVTVKGHVESVDSLIDTSFNGTVSMIVRDAEHEVVCKLNDSSSDGASSAFTYYDRDNILYNGSNDIKSGEFSFSFAVPMDIDYANQSGIINIFALDSSTLETVNGYSEDFLVGGTGTIHNDSIGPSLYCYLNTTSFVNGGDVNSTPYFVAEIMDNDGINASGSGIGHDMTLTIDGDSKKTYNLNDNFQYEFGSYTKGSTYYSIPELESGKHKLKFKAWDILNNSSTAELDFNVVSGLKPDYLSIGVTTNPASTNTTFIINHDRVGSNLKVEIDVFDISGRPLWKHSESGVSTTGTYTIDWDLTGNNGGRLHTGVYVYRVRLSSDGSDSISKAQKLVIIER